MRKAQVAFSAAHPGKRYRHEKPDIKNLIEKKDENYVDVSSATWLVVGSVREVCDGFWTVLVWQQATIIL